MLVKQEARTLYYWAHDIHIHTITRNQDGSCAGTVQIKGTWTENPSTLNPYAKPEITVRNLTDFSAKVGELLGGGITGNQVVDAISGALEQAYTAEVAAEAAAAAELAAAAAAALGG